MSSPSALIVLDCLGLFSFFPILKIYKNLGPAKIYYYKANSFGLMIVRALKFFGVVQGDSCRIEDIYRLDTQYTKLFESYFVAFKICHAKLKIIEETVGTFSPGLSKYSQDLLVAGVKNTWIWCLAEVIWWQTSAEQTAKELNISSDRVVVVSIYASLMKELISNSSFPFPPSPVPIIQQPFRNRVILLLCWSFYWSLRDVFLRLCAFRKNSVSKLKVKNHLPRIVAAAVWGITGKSNKQRFIIDDLFWWKSSGISGERVVYVYDRPDFQPTAEKIILQILLYIFSIRYGNLIGATSSPKTVSLPRLESG